MFLPKGEGVFFPLQGETVNFSCINKKSYKRNNELAARPLVLPSRASFRLSTAENARKMVDIVQIYNPRDSLRQNQSFPATREPGRKVFRLFAVRGRHFRRVLHRDLFAMNTQNRKFRNRTHRRGSAVLFEIYLKKTCRGADCTTFQNLYKAINLQGFCFFFVTFFFQKEKS